MDHRPTSTFLQTVAARLFAAGLDFRDLLVLTPSRRSVVFLRQALAAQAPGPIWAPRIQSVEDYLRAVAGRRFPEEMTLMPELYRIYLQVRREASPGYAEDFAAFYPWGQLMLKDFDEIDRFLADPAVVLRNLQELREIDAFFEGGAEEREALRTFAAALRTDGNPNALAIRFLGFWATLAPVYQQWQKRLDSLGWAYDGWAYRAVAETPDLRQAFPYARVAFAGFNALTKAEEVIMDRLANAGKASIFWDADAFFMPETDEATPLPAGRIGKYIQRYHAQWMHCGSEILAHNRLDKPVTIELTGIPYAVSQAAEAARILAERAAAGELPASQAVVLGSEDLLMPVLDQLPAQIGRFNITMGYPLSLSQPYQFLLAALQFQAQLSEPDGTAPELGETAYKPLLEMLSSGYLRMSDPENSQRWQDKVLRENRVKVVLAEVRHSEGASPLWKAVFSAPAAPDLPDHALAVFAALTDWIGSRNDPLEQEICMELHARFNLLYDAIASLDEKPDRKGFFRLFREAIRSARIPFEGEPLEGLQVMGFLETRLLDFDTVFILGCNEGTLPRSASQNSLIPYHLRKAYGLPTTEDQDLVTAYHFFRLLQRPKHVYLLYNTQVQDLGGAGEMSRYLRQVLNFSPNPALRIRHVQYAPVAPAYPPPTLAVAQSEPVREALRQRFCEGEGYFSATALGVWLTCPLQFYFRYVLHLREEDTVQDGLDALLIGSLLHQALETLYRETMGGPFSPPGPARQQAALDQAFLTHFPDDAWSRTGINRVYRKVLEKAIATIVDADAAAPPFEVADVERELRVRVSHPDWGQINLGGMIDRIDRLQGGGLRLADYKTGQLNETEFQREWEQVFAAYNPLTKPLQGALYAWLQLQSEGATPAAVVFVSTRGQSAPQVAMPETRLTAGALSEFEERLMALLHDIWAGPFSQTPRPATCALCDFRGICQKRGPRE